MSLTTFPRTGNVAGPASATDGHLAVFDGTTGKLIKDGGAVPAGISGLTTNTLPKATSATTIGDSQITDNGTNVAIRNATTAGISIVPPTITIGTLSGGNGTTIQVSDTTQQVNIAAQTASVNTTTLTLQGDTLVNITSSTAINIDSGAGVTTIGDVNGAGNGTTLVVDDASQTVTISSGTEFHVGNGIFPRAAGEGEIGGTGLPFSTVYIGSAANQSTQQSSAATANRAVVWPDGEGNVMLTSFANANLTLDKTITAGGTTGARTIDKPTGSVNFAAAASSLVVTNSLVTTSSVIIATVGTNDTTMKSVSAVAANGSFTLFANAAAAAETRVNFIVSN